MQVVETNARIRREYFIKGKTIKEIARDLRVSRNTVCKVLRSGETSFAYEREVQPRPKLGRWRTELGSLLAVPLSFAPGEAYQFDWSHEVVLLSGVTVIVKVGRHLALRHPRGARTGPADDRARQATHDISHGWLLRAREDYPFLLNDRLRGDLLPKGMGYQGMLVE